MKTKRFRRTRLAAALLGATALVLAVVGSAVSDPGHAPKIRWDIVSIDFEAGAVNPGGQASASANDGSKITLTGRGTFLRGHPRSASGGGTWTTFDSAGNVTGSGTYGVTNLLRWHRAPGTLPPLTDNIGDAADARAGLAVLAIRFSDGQTGHLVVSCELVGTPGSVFEGIVASKGFVDFWNREAPVDAVDANRTVFHVVD